MAGEAARDYCTFRLENRLYGFDLLTVKEVNTQTLCTPVPHSKAAVRGFLNLRGQILLVLDLRLLLGLESAATPMQSLILLKPQIGESLAVVVDTVGDIVQVPDSMLEPWTAERAGQKDRATPWLPEHVARLEKELLIILNPRKLLAAMAESGERHHA